MRRLLVLLALLVLFLGVAGACAGPTQDQVAAAKQIKAAYEQGEPGITREQYELALAILESAAQGGWAWWEVALGVGGVVLGSPLLGTRIPLKRRVLARAASLGGEAESVVASVVAELWPDVIADGGRHWYDFVDS